MSLGILQRWRDALLGGSKARAKEARADALSGLGVGLGEAGRLAKPWMDLGALMAIESLELRVRHLVRGVSRGIHRALRRGTSAEFAEYRPYLPGDDLRHLDWRRMARTNRALVRQYEDEAEWTAMIVLDLSASMGFGSTGYSKADYARTFGGTLGMFLQGQGDAVGLVRFGRSVEAVLPATSSQRNRARWWSAMSAEPGGDGSCLGEALETVRQVQRRPAVVVVLSDFLMPVDSWRLACAQLRASGHRLVMIEVLDEAETGFGFSGDTRFEGLEGERALELDPVRVREEYLGRLREHREAVERVCVGEGGLFWNVGTRSPMEPVLRSLLTELARLRERRMR